MKWESTSNRPVSCLGLHFFVLRESHFFHLSPVVDVVLWVFGVEKKERKKTSSVNVAVSSTVMGEFSSSSEASYGIIRAVWDFSLEARLWSLNYKVLSKRERERERCRWKWRLNKKQNNMIDVQMKRRENKESAAEVKHIHHSPFKSLAFVHIELNIPWIQMETWGEM